jgi:hypothetical protein
MKPASRALPALSALAVLAALAALSAAAIAFFYSRGELLCYGDAAAHVNIARRIVDSRTPGWDQIGTVWLPLPHLLMIPFVRNDWLWQTGLAGAIPSGICFALAGVFLFLAARRVFSSGAAGAAACLLAALNPNVLYLQSLPMTEALFLASLAAVLYFTVRFRESQSVWSAAAAGAAALAGSMTRYEGWFVIPFAALYFLLASKRRRWLAPLVFGAIAGAGPVFWLAHNWWYFGNPLEFYNGPYSARAINQRAVDAGMARYPGDHEWVKAWFYFRSAVEVFAGRALVWIAAAGIVAAVARRALWPLALLALPPVFYVISMHSSGTPIFLPHLWPNSYYNTRYAMAALPLMAMSGAALVAVTPVRLRALAAIAVLLGASAPWMLEPRPDAWICWKESQVNSEARRAWTRQAAQYVSAERRPGDTFLTSFGDLTGIFQQAGIPLRETLHEGNGPEWLATVSRPDLFLRQNWAVAQSGDAVATAVLRTSRSGPRYDCVKTIAVKGAPVVEIYRRVP